MAFSFGSTSTTPAPAPSTGGGFSFGSTAAPTPAAPAPSTAGGGGFSFGSTPAPATAAPTGGSSFSFGSAPASAPVPAAAPSTSAFSFATPSAAAPTTSNTTSTFGFGTPAAASMNSTATSTSLFHTTPSATTTAAGPQQMSQNTISHLPITANTPYKSLPPNAQKLIDDIYNLIHRHEQTMAAVSTMQPSSISHNHSQQQGTDAADIAAGTSSIILPSSTSSSSTNMSNQISSLECSIKEIKQNLDTFTKQTDVIFKQTNVIFQQTYHHAVYPLQSTAARHGLLSSNNQLLPELNTLLHNVSDIAKKLNSVLMESMIHVDYVQGMPSVYLWNVMDDYMERLYDLDYRLNQLSKKMRKKMGVVQKSREQLPMMHHGSSNGGAIMNGSNGTDELSQAVENHLQEFVRIADVVAKMHTQMEELRKGYKDQLLRESFRTNGSGRASSNGIGIGTHSGHISGGNTMTLDPFLEADERERNYERRLEQEAFRRRNEAAPPAPAPTTQPNTAQPAPAAGGGLFGAPAPASGGGLFGTPTPASGGGLFGAPTPAPSTGGGFFGAPTPAPSTGGGLFGAPAPSTGGALFGAPAPAAGGGGLFGSTTPAPVTTTPAPSGGLFGSSAPAPGASSFSFGSTPATPAAPTAGGGLFGSTPAPATGAFGFGNASNASSSTSRARRKSGSRRR